MFNDVTNQWSAAQLDSRPTKEDGGWKVLPLGNEKRALREIPILEAAFPPFNSGSLLHCHRGPHPTEMGVPSNGVQ